MADTDDKPEDQEPAAFDNRGKLKGLRVTGGTIVGMTPFRNAETGDAEDVVFEGVDMRRHPTPTNHAITDMMAALMHEADGKYALQLLKLVQQTETQDVPAKTSAIDGIRDTLTKFASGAAAQIVKDILAKYGVLPP